MVYIQTFTYVTSLPVLYTIFRFRLKPNLRNLIPLPYQGAKCVPTVFLDVSFFRMATADIPPVVTQPVVQIQVKNATGAPVPEIPEGLKRHDGAGTQTLDIYKGEGLPSFFEIHPSCKTALTERRPPICHQQLPSQAFRYRQRTPQAPPPQRFPKD